MAQYKRGRDDIIHSKADASLDLAGGNLITANGERGTLTLTAGANVAHNSGISKTTHAATSIAGMMTFTNSSITATSVIVLSTLTSANTFSYILNIVDGSCYLFPVNNSGAQIDDDDVIKIAYHILN